MKFVALLVAATAAAVCTADQATAKDKTCTCNADQITAKDENCKPAEVKDDRKACTAEELKADPIPDTCKQPCTAEELKKDPVPVTCVAPAGGNTGVIVGAVVGIVVIGGIAAYFLMGGDGKEEKKDVDHDDDYTPLL